MAGPSKRASPAKRGRGRPSKANTVDGEVNQPDPKKGIYEVEAIIDHADRGGKLVYRVRWKGYAQKDDTWEPEKNLKGSAELLDNYKATMADDPDGSDDEVEAAVKRPRGRPPKNAGKPKSSVSAKKSAKSATSPKKRGPGRPRKT